MQLFCEYFMNNSYSQGNLNSSSFAPKSKNTNVGKHKNDEGFYRT